MNLTNQREKAVRNEFNLGHLENCLNTRLHISYVDLLLILRGQYFGDNYDSGVRFLVNHIYLKEKKEEFLKWAETKSNIERKGIFAVWCAVNLLLLAIFVSSLMKCNDEATKYSVIAMFFMVWIAVLIKYIFDRKKANYFDKLCEMTIEDAELFINNGKG